MSDLLDPATLTPESLYRLQSETWAQGADYERERIIRLLDTSRMCTCKPTCRTDINIYAFVLEELGIDLFKLLKEEK